MTIAGEEIEVDPLEGEMDPTGHDYLQIDSSLISFIYRCTAFYK